MYTGKPMPVQTENNPNTHSAGGGFCSIKSTENYQHNFLTAPNYRKYEFDSHVVNQRIE